MPKLTHAKTLPLQGEKPTFLRSKSSEALLKATYEIRRKHHHLLQDVGKKERRMVPRATSSSLELRSKGL